MDYVENFFEVKEKPFIHDIFVDCQKWNHYLIISRFIILSQKPPRILGVQKRN